MTVAQIKEACFNIHPSSDMYARMRIDRSTTNRRYPIKSWVDTEAKELIAKISATFNADSSAVIAVEPITEIPGALNFLPLAREVKEILSHQQATNRYPELFL